MDNKYIDIYPDCSGNSKFGIAITILDNEDEHIYSLKTNNILISKDLGSYQTLRSGTQLGEAYAIVKSLELIEDKNSNLRIFTDCEQSFRLFNSIVSRKSKRTSPKFLSNECLLSKFIELSSKFDSVEVFWIKGHSGIFGNSISDTLSRKTFKTKSDKYLGKIQKMKFTSNIFGFNSESSDFASHTLHRINLGI